MSKTLQTGPLGEEAAMEWLRNNGFLIVERNWRNPPHEIDLIAQSNDGGYHFVEVKTRQCGALTSPHEAITRKKISNLTKAANVYIESRAIDAEAWIDFIAVEVADDGSMTTEYIPDVANLHW